jgi:hypothetical protein
LQNYEECKVCLMSTFTISVVSENDTEMIQNVWTGLDRKNVVLLVGFRSLHTALWKLSSLFWGLGLRYFTTTRQSFSLNLFEQKMRENNFLPEKYSMAVTVQSVVSNLKSFPQNFENSSEFKFVHFLTRWRKLMSTCQHIGVPNDPQKFVKKHC